MDRVPGERDPGADVEMMAFVQLRHDSGTRRFGGGCAAAATLALAGCAGELSTLDPAGPAAARTSELWWAMLGGALLILAGVIGAALFALKRERRGRDLSTRRVLIGWGLLFPTLTMLVLLVFALARGEQLLARHDPALATFHVEAGQWGWRVAYPGGQRTTGVLHVPAGERFAVIVTSTDVIHSFWVPRLGGKIDAIPGKANRIVLRADAPGAYRGACAEYCGVGHAGMLFEVRAHSPGAYPAALAAAARETAEPPAVHNPRRGPVGDRIEGWIDRLKRWARLS